MTAPFQPSPDPDGTIERIPIGGVIRFERPLSSRVDTMWAAVTELARLAGTPVPRDRDVFADRQRRDVAGGLAPELTTEARPSSGLRRQHRGFHRLDVRHPQRKPTAGHCRWRQEHRRPLRRPLHLAVVPVLIGSGERVVPESSSPPGYTCVERENGAGVVPLRFRRT